jgi:hypothetical protein
MKEFKGTKDEIKKFFTEKGYLIVDKDNYILDLLDNEHNANLIVDAFKVRQSINCELSELLEQRNEMLAMLKNIYTEKINGGDFDTREVYRLIKKVKDNG